MSETGKTPSPGAPGIEAIYEAMRRIGGAEAPAPPSGEVAAGVRVQPLRTPTLPPAAHTGCYVVGPSTGPGALIVIDPASPYPEEQAVLDAFLDREAADGRPVTTIALTHHHGDHVSGAAHLAARLGVPVAAHAETASRVRFAVDRVLADGDVLEAGGVTARALFTPGHAPGHLCFVVGDAIVAGDMVAGVGTILIDPDEGDMIAYLASLERMRAEGAARLLPSHGPVVTDADGKLREYVAHRLMREAKVAASLRAHAGLPRELVPDAYADTPPFLWGLAERSLIAHLVKLARDGVARRDDDGTWHRV
jgi:glyoxylase-like metal-dependent hydrolase (beta-lactamase superfamily II)